MVRAFVGAQPSAVLFVSSVTFAEIRYGIERLRDADRRADLLRWLDVDLRSQFEGRVVAISEAVLVSWRGLMQVGREHGHTFAQPDALIAACAAVEQLVVASRDTSEFVAAGIPVFDPWGRVYIGSDGVSHPVTDPDAPNLLMQLTL